jgi:hypothetical protein
MRLATNLADHRVDAQEVSHSGFEGLGAGRPVRGGVARHGIEALHTELTSDLEGGASGSEKVVLSSRDAQ